VKDDAILNAPELGPVADTTSLYAAVTSMRTVPAAFATSETFDIGVDLGSPVSPAYFDRRPFPFTEKIEKLKIELK
jgi:arylsulfatase